MTIKNYINIHDRKTFENKILTIKPFSMFGKEKSLSFLRDFSLLIC